MKPSTNTKTLFKTTLFAVSFLAVSCQRMQFAEIPKVETQASLAAPEIPLDTPDIPAVVTPPKPPVVVPVPVTPPPVVVVPSPVVIPKPKLSNGACAADSSTTLTSCQKCNVPLNPPALPQFSKKGQSLIDILAISCSVLNKSAPKNYVAPTKAELIAKWSRLSPQLYPDSAMSAFQISTIEGLKTNPVLQEKMFGGLWYQPPYSDAFETYFGIEVAEVVYTFCYQAPDANFTPNGTSHLLSKQYLDCTYQSSIESCRELPDYIAGNVYRSDLRAGMRASISNPYVSPKPTPSKTCAWEKFDGLYSQGGAEQIGKWLVSSQKISMDVKGIGGRCSLINSLPIGVEIPNGEVILSAYVCK
jgi:hypothetical protein